MRIRTTAECGRFHLKRGWQKNNSKISCGDHFLHRSKDNREDCDVILLSEGLRGLHYRCGLLHTQTAGALESEQFSIAIRCLHYSISEQRESIAGAELEDLRRVLCISLNAERP